jgi:hypothetical protein
LAHPDAERLKQALDSTFHNRDRQPRRPACRHLPAHVWFFFSEPVQATLARHFGLMLLTDAMARSPTLSMASYDRLFPSQDTLPKGGFGNLIALPLQRQAREHGNTLFVDEHLVS